MTVKEHWENVYTAKESTSVSWYQATPTRSLDLIGQTKALPTARIVDVGGGDSMLVDHLIERGYSNLLVLDISPSALERAKRRLGVRLLASTG